MPNSLKCKIKHICHNRTITESERDRILKALEQEPCEDTVSRKEVLNQIFYSTDNSGDVVLGSALWERIERLPSVTPQESVINKIRAEIMSKDGLEEALEIIDKYRAESEVSND